MRKVSLSFLPAAALAAGLSATALPVRAQTAPDANALGGVGQVETLTVRAKVSAVDMATRQVTLVGADGESIAIRAGDEVRNLAQVQPGDTVIATYRRSTTLVLGRPGSGEAPPDSLSVSGGRAAKGQLPAGAASARLVVTGTVVGVDQAAHTLQLVNPQGGRVVTVAVTDPQRQQQMTRVKVGDSLTVIYSEAVAVAVERVP